MVRATPDDLIEWWRDFLVNAHPGDGSRELGEEKGGPDDPNYGALARSIFGKEPMVVLDLSYPDVEFHNEALAKAMKNHPELCRKALMIALREELPEPGEEGIPPKSKIWVNYKDLEDLIELDDLREHHVGQLISSKVDVSQITPTAPHYDVKIFQCEWEGHTNSVKAGLFDQLREPRLCRDRDCKCRDFDLVPEKSTLYAAQWVKIQAHQVALVKGAVVPRPAVITHGLAGISTSRAMIVHGVWRFEVLYTRKGGPSPIYHYLEVYGFEKAEEDVLVLTEEDRARNAEIAARPDVIKLLARSFAPGLRGLEMVKVALVLQILGGVRTDEVGGSQTRHLIHQLLIGDPGVGKSDLLRFASLVHPHSVYTSGEGSSGVGLSYAVLKDEQTGRYYVEPGVLALAHLGMAVVDEVSELKPEDLNRGKTSLESGFMPVAKAGIIMDLPASTAFLGGGNPPDGKLSPGAAIDQIRKFIAPAIRSRMDLIWIMRDEQDEAKDLKLAEAILGRGSGELPVEYRKDILTEDELLRFFTEAIEKSPEIPRALHPKFAEIFALARSVGGSDMTMRQLQTLTRLSQAAAKARFADEVKIMEVDLARDLQAIAMGTLVEEAARPNIDKLTLDGDRALTTKEKVFGILQTLEKIAPNGVDELEWLQVANQKGITEGEFYGSVKLIKAKGEATMEGRKWKTA